MSVVNLREKSILAKVVYYGPPLGGKTTSLKHIHHVMDPERRTNLISLNTDHDRTLFFDFLPLNLGRIGDLSLRIQGFTVPGQVKYLLTRRYVLRGADAVVFVADSRASERESNLQSLRDLRENLEVNGISWDSVPLVLAYNKRDEAPVMTVEAMDRDLNGRRVERFETVATEGKGVFEAFTAAAASMVERICTEYRIPGAREAAGALRVSLGRVGAAAPPLRRAPAAASVVTVDGTGATGAGGELSTEQLLERALATNMRVAELLAEVQEARTALQARVDELQALYRTGHAAASTLDEDRVVATVVEGAAAALRIQHASILLRDAEDGTLRERGVHGFLYDPLVAGSADAGAGSPLDLLLASPDPVVVTDGSPPGVLEAVRSREPSVRAAVAAPLRVRDEVRGLLLAYWTGAAPDPGPAAASFLGALAAASSVALENARLHGTLERFNRELEAKVAERTRELEGALAELRQLDRMKEGFLSTMSHELMTPLAGIRSSVEILLEYPDTDPREKAEFLRGIQHESIRLTARLQDILDLSALDGGRVRMARKPVVPREAVQGAIDRTRPSFEERGVRVNFWPQTGLPKLLLDERWLGRALDHLLDNAAKFSPANGEVDVTVEREGGGVRVSVRDRGPGIAPEERESLFRRFKQIGSVLTDKPPGIGAGLPLARRIVEAHGGTIGLDGGPGKGTVAWIRLPA
jgi:signal transduction histidine kinase/signal recognition particle receptor subunit beta